MRAIKRALAVTVGVMALTASPSFADDAAGPVVDNPGPIQISFTASISLGSLTVNVPQSSFTGTVAANGDITIPQDGAQFGTIQVPYNGITLNAAPSLTAPVTGTIVPATKKMALLVQFKVKISSGSIFPDSCEVGPMVVNKLTTFTDGGENLSATGGGTLAKSGIFTPRIGDGLCADYTDTANSGLGLGGSNGRMEMFAQVSPMPTGTGVADVESSDSSVVVPTGSSSSSGSGSKGGTSKNGGGSNGGGDSTGPAGSSDARIVGTKIYYDEGEAYVRVACDADDGERCKGTLRIKHGKKIIGRSSYRVEAGDVSDVDVPIKIAKKTVRKGRAIKVTATLFTGMKPKKLLLDI